MNRPTLAIIAMLLAAATAHAAELRAVLKDQHGKPLADAVILATPDAKNGPRGRPQTAIVDQVDKQFVPYVSAIYMGSTVRFPNKDNIRHQVYSFSPAKKFELPLYADLQGPPVTFDTPGVVVLGCNIHDWMLAYIYVAETPFFSQTHESGMAALTDLPSGAYSVRVWHPGMEQGEDTTIKHVVLAADGVVSLEWRLPVKPHLWIPRVSGDGSTGYP